jgi:hypothetical protein
MIVAGRRVLTVPQTVMVCLLVYALVATLTGVLVTLVAG